VSTSAKEKQQTIADKMINANKIQPVMFGSWLLEKRRRGKKKKSRAIDHRSVITNSACACGPKNKRTVMMLCVLIMMML
jgi:hypothetical protein